MGGQELRDDGRHVLPRDAGRRRHPHQAADRTVTLLEESPERFELGDERSRSLVEAMPLGREAHPARGALQQANAEALLEAPHVLSDRGRRDREALCGGSEAPALDGEDEGVQPRRRQIR